MAAAEELEAWAASGAMALTGRAAAPPLGPPAGLVTSLRALSVRVDQAARALGAPLEVDVLALLGERAALAGLHRRGATSVGGATRLVETADGWLAISLARPDDVDLVPAWLQLSGPAQDPWLAIEAQARTESTAGLVERGRWLGLPVSGLGDAAGRRAAVVPREVGRAAPTGAASDLLVVELGSLWAAPLCGSLLAAAGATVVKVESVGRPDGARRGPPAFFDLLNCGKQSVALDLARPEGIGALAALLACADVVIEASRPRALEHLGIDAESLTASGPRAWISITGHGRRAPEREWVAFGDDAAVSGGLVVRDDAGPVFCADAVADPVTGVLAAAAAMEALAAGGRWVLDLALSAAAGALAGPTLPVDRPLEVAEPRARSGAGRGPALGAHTTRFA